MITKPVVDRADSSQPAKSASQYAIRPLLLSLEYSNPSDFVPWRYLNINLTAVQSFSVGFATFLQAKPTE